VNEFLNALITKIDGEPVKSTVKPHDSASLRKAIAELAASENTLVPAERRVTARDIETVAARSLTATAGMERQVRFFRAYRDVAAFVSMAIHGKVREGDVRNRDLLPVGHPLSERRHAMTASAHATAYARWVAADPRIAESARELVTSAYLAPVSSIEYTHATTRLRAMTAGAVPQDVLLALSETVLPIIAVGNPFTGNNSSLARSLRARMQHRDRHGQFAFEGGGIQFFLKSPKGVTSVTGRFAGNSSTSNAFIVEVHNDPVLKNGLYAVPAADSEATKAYLPLPGGAENQATYVTPPSGVKVAELGDLTPMQAPDGWTLIHEKKPGESGPDRVYKTEDGYSVAVFDAGANKDEVNGFIKDGANPYFKSVTNTKYKKAEPDAASVWYKPFDQNAVQVPQAAAGKWSSDEPFYFTFRDATDHTDKQWVGLSQSWADVNDLVQADQPKFEKAYGDIVSGKESAAQKKIEQDKLDAENAKKKEATTAEVLAHNDAARAQIAANLADGKDAVGNDLPGGWTPVANDAVLNPTPSQTWTKPDGSQGAYFLESAKIDPSKAYSYEYTSNGVKFTVTNNEDGSLQINGADAPDWNAAIKMASEAAAGKKAADIYEAKKAVASFDPNGDIAAAIDAGASPSEINAMLDESPEYKQFLTGLHGAEMADFPNAGDKALIEQSKQLGAAIQALGTHDTAPGLDPAYADYSDEQLLKALNARIAEGTSSDNLKKIENLTNELKARGVENIPSLQTDEEKAQAKAEAKAAAQAGEPAWNIPDGAFKLVHPEDYQPEGRIDEVASDYTDDPKVLANKFNAAELKDALAEAVLGVNDSFIEDIINSPVDENIDEEAAPQKGKPGPKKKKPETPVEGSGFGKLAFKGGDEFVPADALYNALIEQGVDAQMYLAELYDYNTGENKNVSILDAFRNNKPEEVKAAEPKAVIDNFDQGVPPAEDVVANPDAAARVANLSPAAVAQLEELSKQPDSNPHINEIADYVKSIEDNNAPINHFIGIIDKFAPWAIDGTPEQKDAFRALWGVMLSLDGGYGSQENYQGSDFYMTLHDAIMKYQGSSPTSAEFRKLLAELGSFADWKKDKTAIANGSVDAANSDGIAALSYRLMAQLSSPNTTDLYRGIQANVGSDKLAAYTGEGNILSFDPRSFSTGRNTAASFAGVFGNSGELAAVIFHIPTGDGVSVGVSDISPYQEEGEQLAWGNYKVVSVKKTMNGDKPIYEVTLGKVDENAAVLNGQSSDYSKLLTPNEDVSLPEFAYTPNPEPYTPQGINVDGVPAGVTDNPADIAKQFDVTELEHAFESGIIDGSGKAILEFPADGGYMAVVDVEAIRDALQIHGVDTNEILKSISSDELMADTAQSPVSAPENKEAVTAPGVVDVSGWTKIGNQAGSNPGGFYQDENGNKYYVKYPLTDLHGENEALASELYKLAGVDSAQQLIGRDGQGNLVTVSPLIPDAKADMADRLKNPDYKKKLQDGFAIDAWLANWDVAGLGFDNVVTDANGDPVRVDPGGALLFRAMGNPKGGAFGDTVPELDSLRDPNKNSKSAAVFGDMTTEQQIDSARKLLDITPDQIDQLVDSMITDPAARDKLKSTLKARRDYILDRYGLNGNAPEAAPSAPETSVPETPAGEVKRITSDGAEISIGMQVGHKKSGETGTIVKYDKGNPKYVYVQYPDGTIKNTSTNQLVSKNSGGGGGNGGTETPSAPETPSVGEPNAVETLANPTSTPDLQKTQGEEALTPPPGAMTIKDSTGGDVWAGLEVTDKNGATATVVRVNKDNYAEVQFPDGKKAWRSGKTLTATGNQGKAAITPAKIKTGKVTPAGTAPVVVQEQLDWNTPQIDGTPSLGTILSDVVNGTGPNRGMAGASAAVDSDSIEDLDVRVMHVKDVNGTDGVRLKFKLTAWAGNNKVKELLKMSDAELAAAGVQKFNGIKIEKIMVDANGVGRVVPNEYGFQDYAGQAFKITTPDGITITLYRANTTSGSAISSGSPKAFHNLVQIQAPAGATQEQIADAIHRAGVVDTRPATPADARILIENRLMSIFDSKVDATKNLSGAEREASLKRIADKYGITPDDVVMATGAAGRIETRLSPEGAQKIVQATGNPTAIQHNVTVPFFGSNISDEEKAQKLAEWIANLLATPQGGLLSTTVRWTEGVGGSGMSSQKDVTTGGADYVFTKPVKHIWDKVGYGVVVYFDPAKLYERLDFYANYSDNFGKRHSSQDILKAANVGAYELMFKNRVSFDAATKILVPSQDIRTRIITILRQRGITEIGGMPLEQAIIAG
jgi:hypothetical protein